MSPEVTALWAAGIGAVAALAGALAGWRAGKAQASAVVEAVRLTLDGQREDALWQAEREAFAALIGQLNVARIAISRVAAINSVPNRRHRTLSSLGLETREEAVLAVVREVQECWRLEKQLALVAPTGKVGEAACARDALTEAVESMHRWTVASAGGLRSDRRLKGVFDDRMAAFRDQLDIFTASARVHIARDRRR